MFYFPLNWCRYFFTNIKGFLLLEMFFFLHEQNGKKIFNAVKKSESASIAIVFDQKVYS
jgi:hypothetical protein